MNIKNLNKLIIYIYYRAYIFLEGYYLSSGCESKVYRVGDYVYKFKSDLRESTSSYRLLKQIAIHNSILYDSKYQVLVKVPFKKTYLVKQKYYMYRYTNRELSFKELNLISNKYNLNPDLTTKCGRFGLSDIQFSSSNVRVSFDKMGNLTPVVTDPRIQILTI